MIGISGDIRPTLGQVRYIISNKAPRLSGQTSMFGVVCFASKSLLGIEGEKKLKHLQF